MPVNTSTVDKPLDPPQPELSEARLKLNEAVADAQIYLQHIQDNVKDYTCLFIKQEKVKDKVLPPEYMRIKIRHEQVENGEVVSERFLSGTEQVLHSL